VPANNASARLVLCALALVCLPATLLAQVTMSLEDYNQLRGRTQAGAVEEPPPPAPWALESADFDITTGQDSARLRTTLRLTLYAEGWQKLPLGNLGSITDLEPPQGLEARVESGSTPQLLLRGKGRFTVHIDSVRPLEKDATSTRPTSYFTFDPPPAALLRGTLSLPAEVEEAELKQGGVLAPLGNQKWFFLAGFEPSTPLTFKILGRRILPERALLPLKFDARVFTATTLTRTQLQVEAQIEVQVAQGRLEELWLELPPDLEVAGAEGGPLAGWKMEGGRLHISPLAPVEDSLRFSLKLRGKNTPAFAATLILPQGSRRTLHLAAAELRGDGLLDLVDPGSARASTDQERAWLGATKTLIYSIADAKRPPRFEAVWAEGTEVLAAQIDRLLVDVAVGSGGRAGYQLWAEVRNRGTLSLELVLPPGFELIAAERDGEPVLPGRQSSGTLEVPLYSGEEKQVVHVAGLLPLALPTGKSGDLSLLLPALSAPAARVEVRLLLPPQITATLADTTRSSAVQPPPQTAASGARRAEVLKNNVIAQQLWSGFAPQEAGDFFARPAGFSEVQAGWSALSSTPAPIALHLARKTESSPWF